MGLGDVFTSTFAIFRRRIGAFVGLTLLQQLVFVVAMIVPFLVTFLVLLPDLLHSGSVSTATVVGVLAAGGGSLFLAVVLAGIAALYFNGLLVLTAHEASQQRFPTVSELRGLVKGYVGRILGLYLLGMLAALVGMILAGLPMVAGILTFVRLGGLDEGAGVNDQALAALVGGLVGSMALVVLVAVASFVVNVKLAYVAQVCAVERIGGFAALKRAWGLTGGSFWRTLGYLLVFSIAASVVQQVVSIVMRVVVAVPTSGYTSTPSTSYTPNDLAQLLLGGTMITVFVVMSVLVTAVQLLIVPVRTTYVTVMYADQLRRHELGPVAHAFSVSVPGYGGAQAGWTPPPGATYGAPRYGAPQPAPPQYGPPYGAPQYGAPQQRGPQQGVPQYGPSSPPSGLVQGLPSPSGSGTTTPYGPQTPDRPYGPPHSG